MYTNKPLHAYKSAILLGKMFLEISSLGSHNSTVPGLICLG